MAWRVWSTLRYGQKWILLFSPLFLLFLISSVVVISLPSNVPSTDESRRSSRALSSTGEFRYKPRMVGPPAAALQQPPPHIYSSAERTSEHSLAQKRLRDAVNADKISRKYIDVQRNRYRNKGIASKRKDVTSAIQSTRHPRTPRSEFTVNDTEGKPRIKPRKQSEAKHSVQLLFLPALSPPHADTTTRAALTEAHTWKERSPRRNADRQMQRSQASVKREHQRALETQRGAVKHSDHVGEKQLPGKSPSRDPKTHHNLPEDPPEATANPRSLDRRKALSELRASGTRDDGDWCRRFGEQDFSDRDQRRVRVSRDLQPLPWLSKDDVRKMELLAEGEVVSKARVPAHGQVLRVALDPPADHQSPAQMTDAHRHGAGRGRAATHSERCQQGHCALIKRTEDWFEVFAFHLDRVLRLNRSLPAVLRTFHSDILPYRYITGTARPAVWWDPDIQHLADKDSDQNSVPLSWVQYQKVLQARCGSKTDLWLEPCLGIQHSEWGSLALFDFLLQVNDRLDRCCCGFTPDPAELCVENLLHAKCANSKDLILVHILVRKADPSRLVFIDNAGRPQQPIHNLNFRLVEGIDKFPEDALSVLRSGCLESLLLHSLYTDREFWDSLGGASGLRPIIHQVEQRGKILLQYIRDKKLRLRRDL